MAIFNLFLECRSLKDTLILSTLASLMINALEGWHTSTVARLEECTAGHVDTV